MEPLNKSLQSIKIDSLFSGTRTWIKSALPKPNITRNAAPSFAEAEYNQKRRTTRREKFLVQMEQLIPWERLEKRIKPHYPKNGKGRQPYPLSTMLRIHCMQLFYNLSDPAMELC